MMLSYKYCYRLWLIDKVSHISGQKTSQNTTEFHDKNNEKKNGYKTYFIKFLSKAHRVRYGI